MVEQMQKEMDAEAAADEAQLRERVRATGELHKRLLNQYIDKYGAPPQLIRLDAPEGVQFVADDTQDQLAIVRAEGEDMQAPLSAETYDQRDPNIDLGEGSQDNGTFLATERFFDQIEQHEAVGSVGFIDTDPDGMS